mmetsp:Transcript_13411/g.37002  ORF Transcript_13411/g.37002 Transcript_13411/m.37002 type:complete len:142 (+) Transcript_13411:65-490(+)
MRKDVECTFGIMKGRVRILKAGVRLHGIDVCDCVWLACCALHNMLIDVDALEQGWESLPTHQQSTWTGEWEQHETEDLSLTLFAIQRLYAAEENFRYHDSSGMGTGSDEVPEAEEDEENVPLMMAIGGRTFAAGDSTVPSI